MGLLIRSILLLTVLLSFPNTTLQSITFAISPINVTAIIESAKTSVQCVLDHLPLAIFDGTMNLYAWNSNSWEGNYELNQTVNTFQVHVWRFVVMNQWNNMKELADGIIKIAQENNEHMLKYVQAHPDQFTPLFTGVHTNYVEFSKTILEGFNNDCMHITN